MLIEISNPLNDSAWTFPVLECIHILGFAFSIGTIAMVDFSLLNFGLRRQAPSQIARAVAPWTLFGLVMMLLSGPMLFLSDPDMYYLNRSFQIKMVLLALAIVFNYTLHRKAAQSDAKGGRAKWVACVSLALWAGVIAGGLFIAFVS
ncbi:MAG TPA: DUF6644 family protein [Bryobacteraceae bacterium]|nr:DUF6644 family protein [Bryobacteraceae bacterium]